MNVPGSLPSIAMRYWTSIRPALTPCVPVVSVFEFQLAESVLQILCFPALLSLIAQLPHNVSVPHACSVRLRRVGGCEGGYQGECNLRLEALWMTSGDEPVARCLVVGRHSGSVATDKCLECSHVQSLITHPTPLRTTSLVQGSCLAL